MGARTSLTDAWPLFGLRLRTEHLELRLPTDDELIELLDLARAGIHPPAVRSMVGERVDLRPRLPTAAMRSPMIFCCLRRLAVPNSISPCSVSTSPRACRWNSETFSSFSSAETWRLTADWLMRSDSPAWVKLPASAAA